MPWQHGCDLLPCGLGMLPSSAVSPLPAPGSSYACREEKAMAFGAGMRAKIGQFYEVEAMSEGGWNRGRPGVGGEVVFSPVAIALQVCLSGSTIKGDKSFKQPPKLDLNQL